MIKSLFHSIILTLIALAAASCTQKIQLCQIDPELLESNRKAIASGAESKAYDKLIITADKLLEQEPLCVISKGIMPPSGDKHDYMSQAPYWWPNPDTPDGLPYIRKDGHINPEKNVLKDNENIGIITKAVYKLGLAYYFSGDEKYAEKAAELTKVWFLDPDTRMNPNLNFGQRVPGVCDGRGIGIIETGCLVKLVDGISLIEGSKSWTRAMDNELKTWIHQFRDWLLDSEHGIYESTQPNNHGTNYDALILGLSLFCGSTDRAAEYMKENVHKRFDEIRSDGVMPREMERATSWSYHGMNLRLLAELATLAQKYGEDYYHYVNINGVTFEKVFDFYDKIFSGEVQWEGSNLRTGRGISSYGTALLNVASNYWTDEQVIAKLKVAAEFSGQPFPDDAIEWLIFRPIQ